MDFIDLKAQQERIKEQLMANIGRVLAHGQYIMGPEIKELEEKLAAYVGVKHALACASGTDALLMALMAYGVLPGDAIFTTPFTFIATAEVVSLLGATPIFVDIDPVTYNIDPEKLEQAIASPADNALAAAPREVRRRATDKLIPRGIIPVDLFGLAADYGVIEEIARKYNLFVIEDAAQSFGGEDHGKKCCSFGDIGCTSFFPAKPLGCYGDGGMCFTNDDRLAALLDSIRVHGKGEHKYDNNRIGINGRLDTLQAAILLAKFSLFPEEVELRNQVAERYSALLAPYPSLKIPHIPEGARSVWAQYSILAQDPEHRARIQQALAAQGIPTAIYYPKPLHVQKAFAYLGYERGQFPVSEACAERIFSIPMHPYLTATDQERIVEAIAKA